MSEPTTKAGRWLDAVMGGDIPDIIAKCEAEARATVLRELREEIRISDWRASTILDLIDRKLKESMPSTTIMTTAEAIDELALVIAKARTKGNVYMDGSHNPLPSEKIAATRFIELLGYDRLRKALEIIALDSTDPVSASRARFALKAEGV